MMRQSVELLTHFSCGSCSKWFTVADAPVRDYWFCPWCGGRQAVAAVPAAGSDIERCLSSLEEDAAAWMGPPS